MMLSALKAGVRRAPLAAQSMRASTWTVESPPPRILITGCMGQIGSELIRILRAKHGVQNVVASDIKLPKEHQDGPFVYCDVMDYHTLAKTVVDHGVTWVVHNSSVISGVGELNPQRAMDVNVDGVRNVFDVCKNFGCRVLAPSTIAVFSPESGQDMTKDDTILLPSTVYGVTKVFLEQIGEYYQSKYGMDFRCLRYPGVISGDTLPGGGTTDYAVLMFYDALKHGHFVCNLDKNEALPMMYMPDCLKATVDLLEAPRESMQRCVYNVSALSFTPLQLEMAIKKHLPNFTVEYKPDFRQDIASTWPNSLDDSLAREHWGWTPEYDLDAMVVDMLTKVKAIIDRGDY
eukprot:TRINITY_DN28670_c2_g1_i3.p1 TRINITY_DN28670_c2_g1~~TRINITY_DN28670_c2_g1_i3.p1  ORF type:complete len:361 (+),score=150.86 TRINITY_DN28670_c2_g1_i3:46-1083(+)